MSSPGRVGPGPRSLTRRRFLRAASLGAGAVAAAPGLRGAGSGSGAIGFAVIGCGGEHCGRGTDHLRDLLRREASGGSEVRVVGVCDVFARHLAQAGALAPKAQPERDYRRILDRKDVDAVVIATPDHWHAKMAIDALEAGKDVYLEKPMTLTIEEARDVHRTVLRTARALQVGAQGTAKGKYWAARELIRSGKLGKVVLTQSCYFRNSREGEWNYPILPDASPETVAWDAWLGPAPRREFSAERFFRWRKYWDYSGGIATDLFYHRLAPLLIALGPEFPSRVTASGGIHVQADGREVPDTYTTTIDYPSGHSILITGTMANNTRLPEVIRGTHATLHLGDDDDDLGEDQAGYLAPQRAYLSDAAGSAPLERSPLPGVKRDDLMTDFIRCIQDRTRKPTCDSLLAYQVMVAIRLGVDAYRRSAVMRFDPVREQVLGN